MDNAEFVVGQSGVLVSDAHVNVNTAIAAHIQAAIRNVSDKPILYLINTNVYGDHTFGNYALPKETKVLAHQNTAESMRSFEPEREFLLAALYDDRLSYPMCGFACDYCNAASCFVGHYRRD